MTEELGKIERPEASEYAGKRMIYVAPLIHPMPGAPAGFAGRLEEYWKAVDQHASGLEARAGIVKHIFHEGVSYQGDPGIDQLKQTNMPAFPLVNTRVQGGAIFEALEDDDLFMQTVDWGRILQGGFASKVVADVATEAFNKASQARFDHMSQAIDQRLGEDEAALLVISSTRGLSLPEGAEIFNIMPPELDELTRWIEETARTQQAEYEAAIKAQQAGMDPNEAAAGQQAAPPPDEGQGLWTPGAS